MGERESGKSFAGVIFVDQELAGSLGFAWLDRPRRIGYIGYWLAQEFEGVGIMTQSVKRMAQYGFEKLGLEHVDITAAKANRKSRSIPERLGFRLMTSVRDVDVRYGKPIQLVSYVLSVKN